MTELIRRRRSQLSELVPLGLGPELESISGKIDGESLFIRNELYRSRGLRKIHLEIAMLGSGLEILHCVLFPDPIFDLPIFGLDIVAGPMGISAAIVDLSPVRSGLPEIIVRKVESLSKPLFLQKRDLPAWGTIFSPHVCFIRPVDRNEENLFLDLADAYLGILLSALIVTIPDESQSPLTIERYQGQISYCLQQKRNDKTRSVLAKAFNSQWADRYIEKILFDNPPVP